jgi:hypothetical protein
MSLADLIRKRDGGKLATAIPAIPATHRGQETATVARIATVAVANPVNTKIDVAELTRLVRLCGERYAFTEAEHAESLAVALADPLHALTCFQAMAAAMTQQDYCKVSSLVSSERSE